MASPLWNLEIGESAGPLAVSDRAIYASASGDLVSVSTSGTLNWRVSVGAVTSAATTPDGVVVGTSGGAVTAIASDGAVAWTFQPDGGFSGIGRVRRRRDLRRIGWRRLVRDRFAHRQSNLARQRRASRHGRTGGRSVGNDLRRRRHHLRCLGRRADSDGRTRR